MRKPRKVSLISVHDYPRDMYSAYWLIDVKGTDKDGYMWRASLHSYEPVAWDYEGERHVDRPDVAQPAFPADIQVTQEQYLRLQPEQQAVVREKQDERRAVIREIMKDFPIAVHDVLDGNGKPIFAADVCKTRDEADTAAQKWVLDRIDEYRRPDAAQVSDQDADILVAMFDQARSQKEYAKCDRIRGRLKAGGIVIEEKTNIGYSGKTKWKRKGAGAGKANSVAVMPNPLDVFDAVRDTARELWEWLTRPLQMALAYSATARNNRLDELTALIDAGTAGLWRIYDGSRPATCGAATTLLAELTLNATSAAAASGGDLTFNSITPDSAANADGTATWFRITDSAGTCVIDGAVGTSGSDLNLNSTSISTGQNVSISSAVITEGNA